MGGKGLIHETFNPGDRLFDEGDAGDRAYIIESGLVEIGKAVQGGETVVVTTLGKGEIVGEMALIDDQPRAATARVVRPTAVLVIERPDFQARLARSDPIIRRLLGIFTSRLRLQTRKTIEKATIIR